MIGALTERMNSPLIKAKPAFVGSVALDGQSAKADLALLSGGFNRSSTRDPQHRQMTRPAQRTQLVITCCTAFWCMIG